MEAFQKKYGRDMPEDRLLSQSCFESFEEKLNGIRLKPETLSQVVSQEEEEDKEAKKPYHARHWGVMLDAKVMVQTRRMYTSTMPASLEQPRTKYAIMSRVWLVAQMRQPGRQLFSDLTPNTFPKFREQLLSKKNFHFRKELPDKSIMAPVRTDCLEYEFQLRTEAFRLTREEGLGIEAALGNALKDPQHRMEHWVTSLTAANAKAARESTSNKKRERSRSSRGNKKVLALTDGSFQSSSSQGPKGKGRGKGQNKSQPSSKGKKDADKSKNQRADKMAPGKNFRSFATLQSQKAQDNFHSENRSTPGICWKFQKNQCSDATQCGRKHTCIGCGTLNPSHDSCGCLENRVP